MEIEGIIWAGVYVQDLAAETAFYKDQVGLRLIRQGAGWADFDAGGGAMLELLEGGQASPEPKDPDRQPVVIGLKVADLNAVMAEMQARGVLFLGPPGAYKNQSWAYFADPEGNRIEIKQIG